MKGISPLIASVMLIAITVALAALVMSWNNALFKSTTKTVENRTDVAVECSSAQITIEDVYITPGTELNGSARVVMKNGGFNSLYLNSLQLLNRTGDNFSTGFVQGPIAAGGLKTVSLANVSVPVCPTDFSEVIASTTCGGISATFDGTPKCL
jgi:flagellin-like protein